MREGNVVRMRTASGVAAVAGRVLTDADELVERLGEAYRREIPEYAALSEAELRTEVLPVSRRAITTFFTAVVAGGEFTPAQLKVFEDSGRARLRMGMPLDSVLHAYRVAGGVTWAAVVAAVQPGEEALLGELAARWMNFIDVMSGFVARGYVSESERRLRQVDARRRELVEALLSANDAAEVAAVSLRFSTVLAAAYEPVLLSGGEAAAHIDALLAAAPTGTLGGHLGQRLLLLVPNRLVEPERLRRHAGRSLLAWGRGAAPGPALLAEVHQVEQLLDTATAEGHETGSFGPDDLLVEQLLLGNERVADALRRRVVDRLAERDPGGLLVTTLRIYLDCGSVPETARRACVHPNTVAYRLGRVRDITGLDARVPVESALLVLGLGIPAGTP
jgi:hypothetical protein